MEDCAWPSTSTVSIEDIGIITEEPSSEIGLESLPNSLLLEIFANFSLKELLKQIALISRRWHDLAHHPTLHPRLTIHLASLERHASSLCCFLSRISGNLLSFTLDVGDCVNAESVRAAIPFLPHVKYLNLADIRGFDVSCMNWIVQNCPNVKSAVFEACEHLDDEAVLAIAHHWQLLEELNLKFCKFVTENSLAILFATLKCLRVLNINEVTGVSDRTIDCLISCHKHTLEEVHLDGEELTDLSVFGLVECKKLRFLDMHFAECLTDSSARYLKTMLPNFEHLHLRKAKHISGDAMCQLFATSNIRNLTYLSLDECEAVDDECAKLISIGCPNLRALNMDWCWLVTNEGLLCIIQCCKALELLSIIGMYQITSDVFELVPEYHLPRLKFLDAEQCDLFADDYVALLTSRTPDLIARNYYGEVLLNKPLESQFSDFKAKLRQMTGSCCMQGVGVFY